MLLMTILETAAVALAVVMWWVFERNTDRLRRVLEGWLSMSGRSTRKEWQKSP
jgi:hypothetical protein